VVTEFSAGITPGSRPNEITVGPDGNLWFTEGASNRIGRITTAGVVTEFSAGITPGSAPFGITAGPDGNLWFTEFAAIGRITPTGVVTEFPTGIGLGGEPNEITTGPDGNLWFTASGAIGRITPSGTITKFTAGITPGSFPGGITAGPDGNLWFTDAGSVGRITTAGAVTLFKAGLAPGSDPTLITAGPDGNLWFTEHDAIGQISPAGQISVFSADITPTNGEVGLQGITIGPDSNLWFTESTHNGIGRLQLPPSVATWSDGGFESPSLGAGQFQYRPVGTPWFYSGSAGVAGNSSAFTAGNPNAPDGTQVGFLQGTGSFSQLVPAMAAGIYQLTFGAAQRADVHSHQDFRVLVDGVLAGTFIPSGTNYSSLTATFTVAAGTHKITFQGLDSIGGDNTAFVDNVRLTRAPAVSFADAGFELPSLAAGQFQYDPAGTPWTYTSSAGVAGNSSGFTAGNPNAPEGRQVGFLQGHGSFSQLVPALAAGTYQLTFAAAQRGNLVSHQDFRVVVDGVVVGTFTPASTSYSSLTTTFIVGAGAHTITFQGLDTVGGDNTAFIDNVRLTPQAATATSAHVVTAAAVGASGSIEVRLGASVVNAADLVTKSGWPNSVAAGIAKLVRQADGQGPKDSSKAHVGVVHSQHHNKSKAIALSLGTRHPRFPHLVTSGTH
jgi:streptogramin lyase